MCADEDTDTVMRIDRILYNYTEGLSCNAVNEARSCTRPKTLNESSELLQWFRTKCDGFHSCNLTIDDSESTRELWSDFIDSSECSDLPSPSSWSLPLIFDMQYTCQKGKFQCIARVSLHLGSLLSMMIKIVWISYSVSRVCIIDLLWGAKCNGGTKNQCLNTLASLALKFSSTSSSLIHPLLSFELFSSLSV